MSIAVVSLAPSAEDIKGVAIDGFGEPSPVIAAVISFSNVLSCATIK